MSSTRPRCCSSGTRAWNASRQAARRRAGRARSRRRRTGRRRRRPRRASSSPPRSMPAGLPSSSVGRGSVSRPVTTSGDMPRQAARRRCAASVSSRLGIRLRDIRRQRLQQLGELRLLAGSASRPRALPLDDVVDEGRHPLRIADDLAERRQHRVVEVGLLALQIGGEDELPARLVAARRARAAPRRSRSGGPRSGRRRRPPRRG